MLSREDMRQVERSLANNEQDTRDEIGFLLIHQGFADRFFPGTSVLHTRIRYALFVPWLYLHAAQKTRRGSDLDATIRRLLIELAIRLKELGGEPKDVIGGDKLRQLTSQPPDRVYWSAMREWKILLPEVESRSEALRRLQLSGKTQPKDDDGGRLGDDLIEVFGSLPPIPPRWDDPKAPLQFKMYRPEREFLRNRLRQLTRPDGMSTLLSRLVETENAFPDTSLRLPLELDAHADALDKVALRVARDAAALAAIGRAVYGALVEELVALDGGNDNRTYRDQLRTHLVQYGESAAHCDLDAAKKLLPDLPAHFKTVLHDTQAYVRASKPEKFTALQGCYQNAEYQRKKGRARLLATERAKMRRAEWDADRHNTTPLHYRWKVVRQMLEDLKD